MNRRELIVLSGMSLVGRHSLTQALQAHGSGGPESEALPGSPPTILLQDYRPKSLYRIPKTDIKKARYPIIDAHCHGPRPIEQLNAWVKTMDEVGVEKTVIFTGASSAERFSAMRKPYDRFPGRFDLWCSFNMEGTEKSGFGPHAVESLEACHRAGARGVGEIMDKGRGLDTPIGTEPAAWAVPVTGPRPHPDDPKLDALWDKCAQLGMPCSIHVSDPIWAYEPMDKTNDGLMNGWKWRIEVKPDMWGHDQLIESLERAANKHPKTIFVACHLANLDYDLTRLGQLFDRNPNLFADISARFAETAPIPRFVNQFFQKYSDRVLYGTDMAYNQRLFSTTFRILESNDEHFYEQDLNFNFDYHWPLNGFGLPDDVLKKIYHDNAVSIFNKAQSNAA
jgi:hypothetical protein